MENDYFDKHLKLKLINTDKEQFKKNIDNSVIPEVMISRNWLIENINSPYYPIFFKNYPDTKNLSIDLNTHLEKIDKLGDFDHLKKMKNLLIEIGFNHFKANILNKLLKESNKIIPGISEEEPLELSQFKEFRDENDRLKNCWQEMQDYHDKSYEEEREKNIISRDEIWELKMKLSNAKSELKFRMNEFFFSEDNLFDHYIFGDKLPEMKFLYKLLKDMKAYKSNWGHFCYSMTYSNAIAQNPNKIELNLLKSELTYQDLGLILFIVNKSYEFEKELTFHNWICQTIKIISKHGNTVESKDDIEVFIKKNYRPYKTAKNLPPFYDLIMEKLAGFI